MAPGLKRFTDVAGDGTPRLDDAAGEELVCVERAASVALGSRAPEPPGTLFITTRRVIWLSEAEKGKGYAVDFLDITLHAVSRDPEAYPSPCLYTQTEADSDEEDGDIDSEAYGDSQLPKISEMRIILADAAQLDSLFDAFCHCAELNPDPTAEENEDSDLFHGEDMANGGWIHGDEDEHMVDGIDPEFFIPNPIGQNGGDDLSSSVLELQINDQRFEDAEEEEARENGH